MPRKIPKLIPYLKKCEAINKRNKEKGLSPQYINLCYEDEKDTMLSLFLPHKRKDTDKRNELVLKDWYNLNGRKYCFSKDYSSAKQAITSALRKTDYAKLYIYDNKLIIKILSDGEVKDKKKLKKDLKRLKMQQKNNESDSWSDSGFYSSIYSPESHVDNEKNVNEIALIIHHDHSYAEDPNHSDGEMDFHEIPGGSLLGNKAFETSNQLHACQKDSFSGINFNSKENATLEDLDKIPLANLIGDNFQKFKLKSLGLGITNPQVDLKTKTYICKGYFFLGKGSVVLVCELLKECNADTNGGKLQIIYDDTVERVIQEYSGEKSLEYNNDNYIMVSCKRPFVNHG